MTVNPKLGFSSTHVCATAKASDDLRRTLKPHMPVRIKLGSNEIMGKVILIGAKQLDAGEECYIQLVFDKPVHCRRGMLYSLYEASRDGTIAEGTILITGLPRVKGANVNRTIGVLEMLKAQDDAGAFSALLKLYSPQGVSGSYLIDAMDLSPEGLSKPLQKAKGIIEIKLKRDSLYMDENDIKTWSDKITKLIKEYHVSNPHQLGPDLGFVKESLKPAPAVEVILSCVERLKADRVVVEKDGCLHMLDFSPKAEDPLEGLKGEMYRQYQEMGYSPLRLSDVARALKQPEKRLYGILQYLRERGYVVRLDKTTFITKEAFGQAWDVAKAMVGRQSEIGLGEFRDKIGCSRRIALLLLERFDKKSWTERRGEVRVKGPKWPSESNPKS